MTAHNRRLKVVTFTLDAVSFECQLKSWKIDPGVDDGDRMYTFCVDGEFTEDTDPDPTLELSFFSDWRANGISDYLWDNDGEVVTFVLDHHPDIAAEHVQFTGSVKIKAPPVGGEARETEVTEITLQCQGMPTKVRI
jgi:hypothetical protein